MVGRNGRLFTGVLKTDGDLDLLLELKREDLERLFSCIRDMVDRSTPNLNSIQKYVPHHRFSDTHGSAFLYRT